MAKQTIGIGAAPDDGTGDTVRVAFDKVNDNTNELYAAFGDGSTLHALTGSDAGIVSGTAGTSGNIAQWDANGDAVDMTAAQARTLLNVADGADVTNTASVTSAGALMDSEVTNLAQVKAFDSSDYATAAQGSTADSALQNITGESIGSLSDVTLTTVAQGHILYRNASGWVNLGPGTNGQYLQTQGAGANPQWATGSGGISWSTAVDADVVPDADGTRDLGSTSNRFANAHVDSLDLNGTTITGSTLADPGGDRGMGWDDSQAAGSEVSYWSAGTGLSFDASFNLNVATANATTQGIVELATAAETTTGTDTGRAVTPDGLAGSVYGQEVVTICLFDDSEDAATGDGAGDQLFRVPAKLNGWNLTGVAAYVQTAGTTGTTDVQIHNVTAAADVLSTKLTIDSGETDTSTAATAAVINAAEDDVSTGDKYRFDVDAVSTTAPKGLWVELTVQAP